jgi:hypothetical protein
VAGERPSVPAAIARQRGVEPAAGHHGIRRTIDAAAAQPAMLAPTIATSYSALASILAPWVDDDEPT